MQDNQRSVEEQENFCGVPIVISTPDHRFALDEKALENLLLKEDVKNRNVVVVSIAGAYRKGKSFLLDFFLRYMRAKYANNTNYSDDLDWMGPNDEPLKGFSWKGGSERDTTGILMWSEIFTTTLPNDEEVAVIFLDTQGTFDSESTVKDGAIVFALSTMLSSVQIYNLSQNIQEDDLQHLQVFTEYGRLALADNDKKPFQKLQILVRDWSYPYEAQFGKDGGDKILNKRLNILPKQHSELQSIRKYIRTCFSDISCFLMPHPGLKVATSPIFDGRLADIESDFKENLKILVPLILAPENLILKEIGGQKVKAKELIQYFKSYLAVCGGDDLPEPKSMLLATAEANNLAAVAAAKETYHSLMEGVCGGKRPHLNSVFLDSEHLRIKLLALEEFSKTRKMGGEEFSDNFKNKLETDIDELFVYFKQHNETKNIFIATRTPTVFFVLAFALYISSAVFEILGLDYLSNVATLLMRISILVLITWFWIRYNGGIMYIGEGIDGIAAFIWGTFMKSTFESSVAMLKP